MNKSKSVPVLNPTINVRTLSVDGFSWETRRMSSEEVARVIELGRQDHRENEFLKKVLIPKQTLGAWEVISVIVVSVGVGYLIGII